MEFLEVKPIIDRPWCLTKGRKQDCRNCALFENVCKSPRSMCARPYPGNGKGCPCYGNRPDCPPNIPMFDDLFNLNFPVYAVIEEFNLEEHVEKRRLIHPDWEWKRLANPYYWQLKVRARLRTKVKELIKALPQHLNYWGTSTPEAMGVWVGETLKQVNIELEFPPIKWVRKVALVGSVKLLGYESVLIRHDVKTKHPRRKDFEEERSC